MLLDPLQEQIARTALALPQSRTLALAGGGAMIVHGFITRPTKDIDLFTEVDDQEARQVVVALRHALEEQNLVTHDTERPPLDHRFITVDPTTGAECTVEVFADGGRLHDRVTLDLGPVLHPDDLAADKMLALWGRARPRDFFDVAALIDRYGHDRTRSACYKAAEGRPAVEPPPAAAPAPVSGSASAATTDQKTSRSAYDPRRSAGLTPNGQSALQVRGGGRK
jgi:Nucleotidyl transferase AbiEii toxin, Type IV TA system